MVFFSKKMIPTEIQYKTHNEGLLAIIKALKTWKDYLEDYKHEVLLLINHNHLHFFMDIKSPSSKQIYWAQALSRYYLQIDYK